ncbi:MAG: Zn-dependent hydrolase [Bacteroidia bacterium]|nr:Zn-dependent hydrolase [Bacteroidia bacterium]
MASPMVLPAQTVGLFMPPPNEMNMGNNSYLAEYTPLKGYPIKESLAGYKSIQLKTDISKLSEAEMKALGYMIEAARHADNIFWMQSYGHKDSVMSRTKDETLRSFLKLNYGPWDRLNDNAPFVTGIGPKPEGSFFYPKDATKEEVNTQTNGFAPNPYSIMVRNPENRLEDRPYSMVYGEEIIAMAENLRKAAEALGRKEHPLLCDYLQQRAEALMNNGYQGSDIAWLNVTDENLDIIIGPIENYEDKLIGAKTSFEAYVLVRDKEWGAKLEKYIKFLPELQKNLPVASEYKQETVSNGNSQLAVFDAVYYAGDCNAGSKTIAVNLPNDEEIQKRNGTRRSQLKNVMRAKFENMVVPITELLIDPAQRASINFNAFFSNVMFHEVAHGLGIKNTITNKGTVREALGANYSAIEECKADVLGLYMVTQLVEKKELEGKLEEYYVTFVASVFRSVRFGAGSAHGKANMITFNTLVSNGAITRQNNGYYKVDVAKMKATIETLAGELLVLQGNGDALATEAFLTTRATVGETLTQDLGKINKAGIPVDLVFEQGEEVLGLKD